MSVLDIEDQGQARNPRAHGQLSYGREGVPPGFTVDTEGNANFLGTVTTGGGGGGGSVTASRGYYTAGLTLQNTGGVGVWQPVAGLVAAIPAVVGDSVEWSPSFMWAPPGGTQFLDLGILVGGSVVRFASTGTGTPAVEGDPALYITPGTYRSSGAVFSLEVEAGDLDAGSVNFVLATAGTGTGTLFGSAGFPFRWAARNFGQ